MTTRLEAKESLLKELNAKIASLEGRNTGLAEEVSSAQASLGKAQERLESAQVEFAMEKSALEETVSDLSQAKEILLSGKVELQHTMETMKR